jgi:hypothetical protein
MKKKIKITRKSFPCTIKMNIQQKKNKMKMLLENHDKAFYFVN